jgi:phospholipase C
VTEPNISAWRRATCGDFTTALRLRSGPARWPSQNQAVSLAAAEASFRTAQQEVFDNPAPTIPAVHEPVPEQKEKQRQSRAESKSVGLTAGCFASTAH